MPDVSPSLGFLQKIGLSSKAAPSPEDEKFDSMMKSGLAKVRGEMPDVADKSVSSSKGSLTGMLMPSNAYAVTNPFSGNITYNPEMMKGMSQDELENTLAHELTHSRQANTEPLWKKLMGMFTSDEKVPVDKGPLNSSYYWRPNEQEAFQTERDRSLKQHQPWTPDPTTSARDIQLLPPRKDVVAKRK